MFAMTAAETEVKVLDDAFQQLVRHFGLTGTPKALVFLAGALLCIAVPYLLGSINPAIVFSRLIYHDDIRNHGSGNAGTTNMLRTFGLKAAALTLICDFLKAILAVWFGLAIMGSVGGTSIAGFFVAFGHMFPIFYRFKGGKGVACAGMVALAIEPWVFVFLLLIFLVVAIGTRYVSLASIMCALFYPLLFRAFASDVPFSILMAFMIMAFVLFMHRENFKRIQNRTESKLDFSKFSRKKKKDGDEEKTEDETKSEQIDSHDQAE